ncbi:MAG: hypothetical protein JSW67_04760 [Candidatus Latescibacterota bacterium]|nr:MAG: hypothetical protein JSW67_04760 [Candidatus Latescibacterota bacterium]
MQRMLTVIGVVVAMMASGTAVGDECVDVDLRAEKIEGSPLDALSLFFSMANCGTEAGVADISISLEKDAELVGEIDIHHFLPADLDVAHEWRLPIPPAVPAGSYRMCVRIRLGEASDTACASVEIDADGNVLAFSPEATTAVERKGWGSVKDAYRP